LVRPMDHHRRSQGASRRESSILGRPWDRRCLEGTASVPWQRLEHHGELAHPKASARRSCSWMLVDPRWGERRGSLLQRWAPCRCRCRRSSPLSEEEAWWRPLEPPLRQGRCPCRDRPLRPAPPSPWEAGTERRSAVRQQHDVQLKLGCVRERPAWTPQDLPSSLEACLTKNLPMNLMKMNPALAPLPGAPDVVYHCTDTGSIGYPLLGSARGAKEAENRLLGRSLDQALLSTIKACNQRDTRSYPGSGRPEAKSPTPACLD